MWFHSISIKNHSIHVKATGAILPINSALVKYVLAWLPFFFTEKFGIGYKVNQTIPPINIVFTPVTPQPWYLVSVCAYRAKANLILDMTTADAIFYFEDRTKSAPPAIDASLKHKTLNFDCNDISKSKVEETFEKVFGYALKVDPLSYAGRMAVKSEINGVHDGYEAQGPINTAPHPNMVYQRLVDNSVDDKWAEDLRCPVIGGEIAIVFVKKRPLTQRFANMNTHVTLCRPEEVLSTEERLLITTFAKAMGLDWGGMDILRDKRNGRIYIVDVNKTDMGPPLALSLKQKARATTILTEQFIKLVRSKQINAKTIPET